MPIYDYYCKKCKASFEVIKPGSEKDDPEKCPKCGCRGAKKLHCCAFVIN